MKERTYMSDGDLSVICGPENADVLWDEDMLCDVAELFKIFADSTRIKILYALFGAELSVTEISEKVEMNQSAVSHQLRVLKQSHLIKVRRDGKNMIYSLADGHVRTILTMGMEHIAE